MSPAKAWQALFRMDLAQKTVKYNLWSPTILGANFLTRNPSEPTGSYGFNTESFDDFISQQGIRFIDTYNDIVDGEIEFIRKWPDSNRAIISDEALDLVERALEENKYGAEDRHQMVDTLIKRYL